MNYLLQTIFEKQFNFVPVNDVFQGMHFLKTNKQVHALIVDLDTNAEESWHLVEHIKSSKLYNIPVVVLATNNNETLKQKSYEYEIDEIFFKPFNPVDLIAAINSFMATEVAVG